MACTTVTWCQRHQYCCFTEPICQCEKQRRHERCAKDGIFVADASDATFETLQQGVAFSGENYNTDQAIIDWSDWDKTHGPHTVKMLDGKTSISNCPVGTITIAATQAQVHIVLPDSCTYAFGTADSYYSTSSDVGGKYEMVYNNYMGPSFVFFEAESATNPMNGSDYEWFFG